MSVTALLPVPDAASPKKHFGCAWLSGQFIFHLCEVFQKVPGSVYNTDYFCRLLVLPSFSLALEVTVAKFTLEEVNREVFLSFLSNMSYIPFFQSLLDCQ